MGWPDSRDWSLLHRPPSWVPCLAYLGLIASRRKTQALGGSTKSTHRILAVLQDLNRVILDHRSEKEKQAARHAEAQRHGYGPRTTPAPSRASSGTSQRCCNYAIFSICPLRLAPRPLELYYNYCRRGRSPVSFLSKDGLALAPRLLRRTGRLPTAGDLASLGLDRSFACVLGRNEVNRTTTAHYRTSHSQALVEGKRSTAATHTGGSSSTRVNTKYRYLPGRPRT